MAGRSMEIINCTLSLSLSVYHFDEQVLFTCTHRALVQQTSLRNSCCFILFLKISTATKRASPLNPIVDGGSVFQLCLRLFSTNILVMESRN